MPKPVKSTLLVVEDDEDFRSILVKILEKAGYSVVSAANGEDGLAAYRREAPALVVLDVQLPDMLGTDICRKIRAEGPNPKTPIILCTVRWSIVSVAEGFKAGASDYILKPFSSKKLLERIKKALG